MAFYAKLPESVVAELESEGLASRPRSLRGVVEVVLEVMTNTSVIVTLLQTPDTLLRLDELLAAWRRGFVPNGVDDTGTITVRTKQEQIVLGLDGDADARSVASLIEDALE